MRVPGVQGSLVQFHGTPRDGQAETNTSALPVAVAFHPVKGIKDVAQRLFRHTLSIIAHLNPRRGAVQPQVYLNRGLRWRIANGVADDVFGGAAQQFCVPGYCDWTW